MEVIVALRWRKGGRYFNERRGPRARERERDQIRRMVGIGRRKAEPREEEDVV